MEKTPVKLNLASGAFPLPGYINIDNKSQYDGDFKVDVEADVLKLEWEADSVDEILVVHFIMYLTPSELVALLARWYGWLKKGGKLVIETGNLKTIAVKIASTDNPDVINGDKCLKQLFGWETTAGHKWAWCPENLLPLLEEACFKYLDVGPGVFHDNPERDFMVVATK